MLKNKIMKNNTKKGKKKSKTLVATKTAVSVKQALILGIAIVASSVVMGTFMALILASLPRA